MNTDVCEHNLLYVCLFVDNNAIIFIAIEREPHAATNGEQQRKKI